MCLPDVKVRIPQYRTDDHQEYASGVLENIQTVIKMLALFNTFRNKMLVC